MDSLFPTSPLTFVTSCLYGDSYLNRCEVTSHCGFDCVSLMINDIVPLTYLLAVCVSLEEVLVQFLYPFLNWRMILNDFCCWVEYIPDMFWILTTYQINSLQIASHTLYFSYFPFYFVHCFLLCRSWKNLTLKLIYSLHIFIEGLLRPLESMQFLNWIIFYITWVT